MPIPELIQLKRPLVVLDTETTGSVVFRDRIVEIAMVKLHPDGKRERWDRRVNPEVRIPIEATAIHGITNQDVEGCPPFRRIAEELVRWIGDADLCGFNIHSFDQRILAAELARCGQPFPMEDRAIVDVQVIFHRREPRDLSAAVRFYLGRDHAGAHGAGADAEATLDVLLAQLERYSDLDRTVGGLASRIEAVIGPLCRSGPQARVAGRRSLFRLRQALGTEAQGCCDFGPRLPLMGAGERLPGDIEVDPPGGPGGSIPSL